MTMIIIILMMISVIFYFFFLSSHLAHQELIFKSRQLIDISAVFVGYGVVVGIP